ncbi:hypothetical protein ACRAWG_15115 [Methylobacterium sp. P31]
MTDQQAPPKKRGRPPKHSGEGARPTVNFRCRTALYERLQEQAAIAERSVSEEIERRLDLSFRDPEIRLMFVGNNNTADLLAMIAHVLKACRNKDGADWSEDEEVNTIVKCAVEYLIMSGCRYPTYRYVHEMPDDARSRIDKVARSIAYAAATLHMAVQDSTAIESLIEPALYMDQYNTPRRLRSEMLRDVRAMRGMYPWGAKRADLLSTTVGEDNPTPPVKLRRKKPRSSA